MRRRSIIHVADNSDYILHGVRLLSDRDFPVEQAAYYRKIGVGIQRGSLSEDLMVWDNSKVRADAGTASTLLSKGTRTIRSGECVYVATESVNNLDFQFDGLTLEVVLRHISGVPRHRLSEGGRDALDGIADYMEITGARDRIITVPLGLLTNYTPPVWTDLNFPASGVNPPGAGSDPTLNSSTGRLDFSASATNTMVGQAQMPHGWVEGTQVEPHIHFSVATSTTDVIACRLEYKISSVRENIVGWTTVDTQIQLASQSDTHLIHELGTIDMSGHKTSAVIEWKFSRLGAAGLDTYAQVMELLAIDFHYLWDSLGSKEEYIK